MTFILDQLKKGDEITTHLKQQILYGDTAPDIQNMKDKIAEAHVCLHHAVNELEFKNLIKQRLQEEFLFMSIMTVIWVAILIHAMIMSISPIWTNRHN